MKLVAALMGMLVVAYVAVAQTGPEPVESHVELRERVLLASPVVGAESALALLDHGGPTGPTTTTSAAPTTTTTTTSTTVAPVTTTTAPRATTTTKAAPPPTTTTTAPPPPATTTTTTAAQTGPVPSGDEGTFVSLINQVRAGAGLPALTVHSGLTAHARSWALHLAQVGSLSHSNIGALLGPWTTVGENVGFGPNASVIHGNLVASSGHYANMTSPAFTHVGVGSYRDASGQVWTAHVFAG